MKRPRVMLADDHVILVEAFELLLREQCDVVGKVKDGRELLAQAPRLEPDVIVTDIAMPNLNGLDASRKIRRRLPDVKLIFLTVNEDPELVEEAVELGADGYLLKKSAAAELFTAIEAVMNGKTYITPLVRENSDAVAGNRKRDPVKRLSVRQREVLQLLAEGKTMKEAAAILHLTPRTIAFHKYRIMEELDIESNAALIQFAIRNGLAHS